MVGSATNSRGHYFLLSPIPYFADRFHCYFHIHTGVPVREYINSSPDNHNSTVIFTYWALSDATCFVYRYPTSGSVICLMVDTCAQQVGAALQQKVSSSSSAWRPLDFFSEKLEPAQVKCSALVGNCRPGWPASGTFILCEGCSFTILTNHKPLNYALLWSPEPWMVWTMRWQTPHRDPLQSAQARRTTG